MINLNTKEYWDKKWNDPARRVEKYSMQQAWWHIRKTNAKSVLDIGCGNGKLLWGVKEGREVFGIDISEVAINRMKKEYGINGKVMDAYDLDKLEQTFDCIVMNHLLEHLSRDKEIVEKCFDRLNPNGTFFVAVPNNMSGPEETGEHMQKYDKFNLKVLIEEIFGNCEIKVIHHHLIAIAKK